MRAQASPWDRQDLVRWTVTVLLGGAASGLAWWLSADRVEFSDQVPYASVGVAGLLVGGYAHLHWLLRGRRAVGVRRLFLLGQPVVHRSALAVAGSSAAGPVFLAVDGRARYHRPDCPLLEGRPAMNGSRANHEAAARGPSGP
jgi:hypothetical protein